MTSKESVCLHYSPSHTSTIPALHITEGLTERKVVWSQCPTFCYSTPTPTSTQNEAVRQLRVKKKMGRLFKSPQDTKRGVRMGEFRRAD